MMASRRGRHGLSKPFRPLGRPVKEMEQFFPKGCRGIRLMQIMREGLGMEEAQRLVPEIDQSTHDVLMKMHEGTISSGAIGFVPALGDQRNGGKMRKRVIEMYELGLSTAQICKETGLTPSGVRNYTMLVAPDGDDRNVLRQT